MINDTLSSILVPEAEGKFENRTFTPFRVFSIENYGKYKKINECRKNVYFIK